MMEKTVADHETRLAAEEAGLTAAGELAELVGVTPKKPDEPDTKS